MYSSPHRGDPGLNLTHLAGLRAARKPIKNLVQRVHDHLENHDGYLAFSGGKDSLVALDIARRADPRIPVCMFDTGFEFPETYTYIADLAEQWDLNLDVIPTQHTTLELLVENGTWNHHTPDPHRRLTPGWRNNIDDPSAIAHHRYGPGQIWGLRAEESRGRKQMLINTISRGTPGTATLKDGTVTLAPIWDWTTQDVWGHIAAHDLPINPVYEKLAALGAPTHSIRVSHILDAGSLEQGRLVWLKRGWPTLYEIVVDVLPRAAEFT